MHDLLSLNYSTSLHFYWPLGCFFWLRPFNHLLGNKVCIFRVHFLYGEDFKKAQNNLENPGIDPGTSHMLSERSTT